MRHTILIAGLALLVATPVAAQEEGREGHRHYRYRIETPYREFGRMGREFGRMGREYGRMGRDYARMYSRDFSRHWGRDWGRSYGRELRNYSRGMSRDWARDWGRMGRGFRDHYRLNPRRGEI